VSIKTQEIEKLAGRLVIGRLPGLVLDPEHKAALQAGTLGGITLFKENARDLAQLATLASEIIAASYHAPVLTVDQEGGAVQRFDHVLSPLPAPMALAAVGDKKSIRAITEISCRQLKTLGFNLLLAPTLDLLTNPLNPVIGTRAFSSKLQMVTSIGSEVIEYIEEAGLIACPKHFPGHGSTVQDSHLELAIVDKSREQLVQFDLAPFAENIKKMRAILIGHIWLPQLEAKIPATLSPLVVSEILRHQLGFSGLAISDDMTMHAITKEYGLGEACVMAVAAGVDLILVCGTLIESQEAVQAIAAAIASGRITETRLQEAISRLNKLFQGKPASIWPKNQSEALSQFERQITIDTAYSTAFSTTSAALMRGSLPPYENAAQWLVLAPHHPRYPLSLASSLGAQDLRYSLDPQVSEFEELLRHCLGKNVVYLTFRSFINSGQASLATRLAEVQKGELLHVAADTPYDLIKIPQNFSASLASFDPSEQAMHGLAQVIKGLTQPLGTCPVDLLREDFN